MQSWVRRWPLFVAVGLSLAAHTLFVAPSTRSVPRTQVARVLNPTIPSPVASRRALERARRTLLQRAHQQRDAGRLELGHFLIRAAAIDALERGDVVDVADALDDYDRRRARFAAALDKREFMQEAVSEAYGDLGYLGAPGGTVVELLAQGAGSCEPLSQLLAAALHDTHYANASFLRYYGGGDIAHLAPIYRRGEQAYDLVAGRDAHPGGREFPASDLVGAYARQHGFASRQLPPAGTKPGKTPEKLTLSRGYPPNPDPFPGVVPAYAEQAIAGADAAADSSFRQEFVAMMRSFPICPVHVSALDTPSLLVELPRDQRYAFELRDVPSAEAMGDLGLHTAIWRERKLDSPADSIVQDTCLALAHEHAALGYALRGRTRLSVVAGRASAAALERARTSFAQVAWDADAGASMRRDIAAHDFGWTVIALPEADELVIEMVARPDVATAIVAAALYNPRTRLRAHRALTAREPQLQLSVARIMLSHELGSMSRRDRSWIELAHLPESDFVRVYRALSSIVVRQVDEAYLGIKSDHVTVAQQIVGSMRDAGVSAEWLAAANRVYGTGGT